MFYSTTYIPKFKFNTNLNFFIKEIKLDGNFIVKDEEIIKRLNFLYKENLFFLNTEKIKKIYKMKLLLEALKLKKIYPGTIKLTIKEKVPIAILFNKKKNFYISDKGDLINFEKIEIYKDLPKVFGNKEKFYILYKDLKNIEFPLEKMKSFLLFRIWKMDLITQDNKIIKLPVSDYLISLNNYMKSMNDKNFKDYKIYDYRIKDQLILN